MCRFAMYMGTPIKMSRFITDPNHSIIKQSINASLEEQYLINGDGFGVGWYNHELSPYPAIYKEITPAWNNPNLIDLARLCKSGCILAHVRKALGGSPVVTTNCHPFKYKKFTFMHNGFVENFQLFKKKIIMMLPDDIYESIKGGTDSEHLFGLFILYYKQLKSKYKKENKLDRMVESIHKVITTVVELENDLQKDTKYGDENFVSLLNLIVCDGNNFVASRHTSGPIKEAHTMYYCTGSKFKCNKTNGHSIVERTRDYILTEHGQTEEHGKIVIVSSEPLIDEAEHFHEIPPNHMVIANRTIIGLRAFDKLKFD